MSVYSCMKCEVKRWHWRGHFCFIFNDNGTLKNLSQSLRIENQNKRTLICININIASVHRDTKCLLRQKKSEINWNLISHNECHTLNSKWFKMVRVVFLFVLCFSKQPIDHHHNNNYHSKVMEFNILMNVYEVYREPHLKWF